MVKSKIELLKVPTRTNLLSKNYFKTSAEFLFPEKLYTDIKKPIMNFVQILKVEFIE